MNDDFNTFWLLVLLIIALLFGSYFESKECEYEEAIQEMGTDTYYAIMVEISDSTGAVPTRKDIARHYLQTFHKNN